MEFRIINGKRVPLPGSDHSGHTVIPDPRKETSSNLEKEYNQRRQKEFIKKRKQQSKTQKKQERINRVFHLELGHAKGFLIKATPALVQLDPNLTAIYTSWKVGKYGYYFLKQVKEDYKSSGNFEESLKNVAKQEVEKKIVSKIKSMPLEKSSQYAANRIWTLCKQSYSDGKIDPKWDKFAENALAKSFEEVGGRLL